jgi:hypothetical protein
MEEDIEDEDEEDEWETVMMKKDGRTKWRRDRSIPLEDD